jgi:hypothetical protein
MTAPTEIARLVETFERNRESYAQGHYAETQLRREYIDPLFKALGWDVDNTRGWAEAYKDVIHEDAIRIGSSVKAPDYCFRIGGTRKFFVEAKAPSVNLKDDPEPAYQLRRYAWSAKLPLSILTDFEEFAVYDCRVRPQQTDKASQARVIYRRYTDYPGCWDEIASIFSYDAVLKGSFDKYAQAEKRKHGTAEVDAAFLAEIERWRDELAHDIALRNPALTNRQLNYAVQITIDRIIFLRICEDRGIERYGQLMALFNGPDVYHRLMAIFRQADDRYNSGLFHFTPEKDRHEGPDELTPELVIDDKPLKDILRSLYYPDSPYEFSVLPAEILGQVYEQFLGKVITLTAGHHARVEDKPEVKKAGGVFYTPSCIVDYIVKQTVGKLLEGRSVTFYKTKPPKLDRPLRVLDPACGSGSFLLGAYQQLLDWYRAYYEQNDPEKWAAAKVPPFYQAGTGGWKLTLAERKRILLDHIYGVDIDTQAVEVTKLSLLLRVLEGEKNLVLFHNERALPDLAGNVKCGNSLIGPDFYKGQQLAMFDEEERFRINAFDWHAEFPEVFEDGGFDAVIGNPPYVRQESLSPFKDYFAHHYEAFDGVGDLYTYFMEKGLKLLRDGGLFSIIVSSSFLRATYGEPLRRTLKKHGAVLRIVDFGGLAVFANAKDTYVCIPLLSKGAEQRPVEISKVISLKNLKLVEYVAANHLIIPHERLSVEAWSLKSDEEAAVFAKVMKAGKPLGEYVERRMFYGLKTGLNDAFEVTAEQQRALTKSPPASKALVKPFLGGQDIRRYSINNVQRYLIVIPCGWTRQQMIKSKKGSTGFSEREAWNWFGSEYPKLAEHLSPFTEALRNRQDQGDYWWELRSCDYYEHLDAPKIIFPDICKGPRFCIDRTGIYLANTAYCLGTDDLYLLGVLNSRLFWFAISNISIPFGIRAGQYRYRLIYQYMERVPIHVVDSSSVADKARHDQMVELVEAMLQLHKSLAAAKTPNEKEALGRQITATDAQIDQLVYELYALTDDEIRIVEGPH